MAADESKPRRQPSAAVGYVVATLVTIPVIIVLVILFAPRGGGGGNVPWYVTGGAVLVFMAVAQSINRYRRYKAQGEVVDIPVVDEPAAAEADGAVVAEVEPGEKGGRIAGRWHDKRFVLSTAEIQAIAAEPEAFDNVIVAQEVQQVMASGLTKWFLVLTRGTGVAVRQDGSQVWPIAPSNIAREPKWFAAMFQIDSVDGRSQRVTSEDWQCVVAWQSGSWDEYVAKAEAMRRMPRTKPVPAEWAMLSWALKGPREPSAWLPFDLPYASAQEGLAKLCAQPDELARVVECVGHKEAAKWVEHAAPADAETLRQAASGSALRKSSKHLKSGIAALIIGPLLGTAVGWFMSSMMTGERDMANIGLVFGCIIGGIFVAFGVGAILYARHLKKVGEGTAG